MDATISSIKHITFHMTLGDSDVLSTCVLITRTHNISQGLLALLALLLSPQRARESAAPLLPFSLSLFPVLLYPLSFPRMPTRLSLHNGPCNQRRVIVTRDAYTTLSVLPFGRAYAALPRANFEFLSRFLFPVFPSDFSCAFPRTFTQRGASVTMTTGGFVIVPGDSEIVAKAEANVARGNALMRLRPAQPFPLLSPLFLLLFILPFRLAKTSSFRVAWCSM